MRNIVNLLAVLAVLWLASPSLYAAAASKDGAAAAEKDPIEFSGYKRWDLAIYTLIVFGLVFFILSRYAFPAIATGLKKREDMIAAAKEDAIAAQKEAEALRQRLQAEFEEANGKIRALMEEARRDADVMRAKEREAGQREAATERERAKREIEAAKDAALQEIYQKSIDLATLISTKAVRRTMSADDHRRLVDEALADMKAGRI